MTFVTTATTVRVVLILVACIYGANGTSRPVLFIAGETKVRRTELVATQSTTVLAGGVGSLQSLEGSTTPQPHRRRAIPGTTYEGILRGSNYIISFKNGTFLSIPISCSGHELYDPIGLDSSILQLITCEEDSRVLTVFKYDGEYLVEEHFEHGSDASNVGIVVRSGVSTALYVVSGMLVYASLDSSGSEATFPSSTFGCQCNNNVKVMSYSMTHVALLCGSPTTMLCLASGIDGQVVKKFDDILYPDALIVVRDKGIVVEVTNYGVKVQSNDLVDIHPVNTPSTIQKVDYCVTNETVYLILFGSNQKQIFVLNSTAPWTDESVVSLVDESEQVIVNNASYIDNSLNLFVYTALFPDTWATKTVEFGSLHNGLNVAIHGPQNPILYDLVVLAGVSQSISILSSTTTSTDVYTSTVSEPTPRTSQPIHSSTATSIVSSSSTVDTKSSSSSSVGLDPTKTPSTVNSALHISVSVTSVVLLLIALVSIILIALFIYRLKRPKKMVPPCISIPLPVRVSNSTLSSDIPPPIEERSTSSPPIEEVNTSFIKNSPPIEEVDEGRIAQERGNVKKEYGREEPVYSGPLH